MLFRLNGGDSPPRGMNSACAAMVSEHRHRDRRRSRRNQAWIRLVKRIGTSRIDSVKTSDACRTCSFHSSIVSFSLNNGSTFQSRRSIVKRQTASVVANLRPMQARGPVRVTIRKMHGDKVVCTDAPMLNALNASDSCTPFVLYQREGRYLAGSGKYRGLYSRNPIP